MMLNANMTIAMASAGLGAGIANATMNTMIVVGAGVEKPRGRSQTLPRYSSMENVMELGEMMYRAEAVKAMVRAASYASKRQNEIELRGFLALFHPELSKKKVQELVNGLDA